MSNNQKIMLELGTALLFAAVMIVGSLAFDVSEETVLWLIVGYIVVASSVRAFYLNKK